MIEINDDETATRILTEAKQATGDEREQMADALIAYGEKKAAEEYNQADEHFSKLFTDEAYFEQAKAANAAVQESIDPDQTAKSAAIGAWLEHRIGRPVDTMSYQVERDAFAMANYGQKNLDDAQFFDFVRGEYGWQKKRTEAINDLNMQAVGKAITDAQLGQARPYVDGMTEVFNTWQQKYPELVDGTNDAAFLSQGYKLYYDTINDLDSVRPQAAQTLTTLEKFTKGESDPEALQTLSNTLIGASPEERQKIYKYVTLAAEAGHIDRAGLDQFAINMGQSFSRGFDFIPQGSLQMQEAGVNNWLESIRNGTQIWVPVDGDLSKAEVGNAPAGVESDAWRQATVPEAETLIQSGQNVREGFKVVRELRNVAKTGVDPIRPVLEEGSFWGTAERGAYGLAGSIAPMAATAVNPFLGALAYQATEYDRIMLENPDINPQFAQGLALVEGVANAATDRLEIANISGRLPMFGRWLDKIASDGVRRTAKIGGAIAFENLQEAGQDLISPLLEAPIAYLRDDMPDKDFGKLIGDWAGQRPETFFATLPLALIGGGVASFRDIKNPSAELNATKLRMAGFSPEQTTFIQRAENPEEYDARIQMEWENRTPDNIKAGEELIQQSISEAQNPPENSAKLEETVAKDGTRMWTVTTPDGKELLSTKDQQAALVAIREHNGAQILNERNTVADMVDYFRAQDPTNSATIEAPRNVQQELDRLTESGDYKGIVNLSERIQFAGIPEDADLTSYNILGEANVETTAEGVFRGVIKLRENSRPEDAFEEINHVFVRKALAEGRTDLDSLRGWLTQTSEATGEAYATETETDIIENIAKVGMDYAAGRIEETSLPASFVDYIKRMLQVFKETMARALKLKDAFATGKIDSNFESFLAESVGLNQQTLTDTVRDKGKTDIVTDGGQMLMDFSIGSRAMPVAKVSNDTDPAPLQASNATIVSPTNFSIGAFHGTPHKVDQFSLDKIGTGEGAQAYGWGLYFAENEKVAKDYQNTLSKRAGVTDKWFLRPIDSAVSKYRAAINYADAAPMAISQTISSLNATEADAPRIARELAASARKPEYIKAYNDIADMIESGEVVVSIPTGNLYRVELDVDDADLIDWDKPLSEQSEKVQEALKSVSDHWLWKDSINSVGGERVGGALYGDIRATFPDAEFSRDGIDASKKASEALLAAGIPGIRYLDEGSRGQKAEVRFDTGLKRWLVEWDEGFGKKRILSSHKSEQEAKIAANNERTYNYVVFDENLIKITDENGQPVTMQNMQSGAVSTDTNYSIGKKQDADYLAAVKSGDMATAQRMVNEAAKKAGYLPHGDFRDSHTAPSGPEGTDEEVKNGETDASLVQVARGVHIQPDDYFDPRVGPRYYSYQDKSGMEAFKEIRAAMDKIQQGKKALVTVFRAVPNDIKGTKLENRDWVTPSKTYAVDHGESRFGEGEYRIINESIPAENLFWDGNDIREWGKDDGKDYTYKNTKNNRKLIDPVTRDKEGNVIPLSQRFNPRSADINYSIGKITAPDETYFKKPINDFVLGNFSQLVLDATGKSDKPILLKSSIVEKNKLSHRDISDAESVKILQGAISSPDLLILDQPKTHPNRWHFVLFNRNSESVLVELSESNDSYDVINWLKLNPRSLAQKIDRAEREGGQVLITGNDPRSAGLSDLPNGSKLKKALDSVAVKFEPQKNYSIASQSEIDRVNKALGGMQRGPDERLKVYERAKSKFSTLLQKNKDMIDAIRTNVTTDTAPALQQVEMDRAGRLADIAAEENSEIAKALQDNADTFMPRIEAAQSSAERKRVERDAKDRAKILEQGIRDKYAERKKLIESQAKVQQSEIVQTAQAKDSAANARMRDKIRLTKMTTALGSLDAILSVLPHEIQGKVGGFTVLTKIGTGDKALANFFIKRIEMIDRELERALKKEYGNALDSLLESTKPKKAKPGEKPTGIGADIQSLFAVVRDARDWKPEQVDGHIANIETQIASGNLTAEKEAILTREADLVSLVGDWKNADSSRRATALSAATETWKKGMAEFVQKKIREREERDMARAEAIKATGKKGKYTERRERDKKDNGIEGQAHGWYIDTLSWDQAVNVLFGHESPLAIRLSDGQRKAEYAKIDGIQAKEDALHDLFTKLAGGKRVDGERLMWDMSQPSIPANGLNLSQLEALTATMMWAQEDGRRHMTGELDETGNPIGDWHYDQKFVDDIESQLSPEAKIVRDFLWNNYGKEWFAINEVFREMNGINLPRIPNYSPITVTPINIPSGMVADPVTGNAVSATSISPGALRNRGVAIAEPVFRNAIQTYIAHTRQMEHWKAFAPWIKEANGILRFRKVHNAMHEASGGESSLVIGKFLDVFAQGGNRDASLTLEISKTMGGMASRAAQVALVGRVGTLAIQFTQIGAASAELPMGAYVSRLGKLMTGNLGWADALNSPYIQRRLKQMPPSVQIAMEGLKAGKPNQLKHQVTKVGQLISGSDALWTAGTYAMVYDYHLGQAKSLGYTGQAAEEYAHNTAERVTDRLAQPTRMGARSIYEITSTNPGSKLGWAFASEARKNLALLAYTKANRSAGQFGTAALGFVLFNLAMGAFIRNAWKDMKDDDDDELFDAKTWNWKRIGVAMATEPLQGIPYLGDYIEKGINAALGQYHQSSDLISFERGVRAIKHIPDIIDGERDMEGVLKDIDGMVSLMGMFNQSAAAAASLTHIASDFFGVAKNAKTED